MNYTDVLKNIDWPTTVLVIDFESYFDVSYSLKKMSTVEYITDERFDFTGLGFAVLNDPEEGDMMGHFYQGDIVESGMPELQGSFGNNFEKVTVVVKNAKFDILILLEKFGINPPYIIDIEDLSRHYDSRMKHRLSEVAPMFGLKDKGDTNQFKGLHYEDMDSETKNNLSSYCCNDVEIEAELFQLLLPKVSTPEIEIPLARHTLKLFLEPKIKFDFEKAEELKEKMGQELDSITKQTGYTKTQLSGNISFHKILCDVLPDGEEPPMKQGKKKRILAIAKTDGGCNYLLTHPKQKVREAMEARQAVKSWPLHVKRIQNLINQASVTDGLLRVPLKYYGGHTGRWSGTGGINLQNLGGRGRAGQGTHKLIQAVRQLLCAPAGHTFLIADSAQIEARLLAWIVGQGDLVDGFRNGEDIYSVFATRLFNNLVRKPYEDDPGPVQTLLGIRRGFGKDAILGCGYGMGTNKFYDRCRENNALRPLFDSGKYNRAFIDKLIKTYRKTYAEIPKFWGVVEKMFKWVTKYPNEVRSYGGEVNTHVNTSGHKWFTYPEGTPCPKLIFYNEKGTTHIKLPSGRVLNYHHSRVIPDNYKSRIAWHWGDLWGGSITENIVQAIARDLLGYWILEFEKYNLPIVLTAHDEIVSCVPTGKGTLPGFKGKNGLEQHSLEFALNIMRSGPDWAEGLPLDAEGGLSDVYKK